MASEYRDSLDKSAGDWLVHFKTTLEGMELRMCSFGNFR